MRFLALLAACAVVAAAEAVDPCKRQPFRGRCPSKDGETPKRSQFVLRYYMRNGECVSYPYGHCASDETEPQLYRYKEECEDACINPPPANLGFPKGSEFDQTYGTVGPIAGESQTQAATEKVDITTETTTTQVVTTTPLETTTTVESTTTSEATTTTTAPTTTTTEEPSTTSEAPTTATVTEAPVSTTETTTTSEIPSTIDSSTTSTTEAPTTTSELPTTTESSTTPSTTTRRTIVSPSSSSTRERTSIVQADTTHRSSTSQAPTTAAPRTECERRRVNAASSTIRGAFVPACTAQGAFEKVQCEPDGRQCFCVDSRGIEIPNSRTRNGQKPDCDSIQSATVPKTKECVGAAVRGPCSASMNRWYYDEQEAKCRRFTYSGCGGNGNNYETEDACSQRCAPPPMGLPKCEKGEPLKTKLGVTVNCAKSDCPSGYKCSIVQQTSVCCPENDKIIGLQTTNPSDVCSMPKERGPCDKYELRFYFNAEVKECKYFFWGGCEGNGNNFEKVEECESACGIAKVKESLPTSTRPSTASNRQPHFRTTQGIRITPVGGVRSEETVAQESTTTPVTATAPTAAPLPSRHSPPAPTTSPRPSGGQSTADTTDSSTAASSVHVAPTRAPPIPQMALLEGSEESQAEGVNRCLHPKDPGNCRGQFIRWFWDNERKLCDVFTYTGCQGNGNNYASREECLAICHKEAAPVVVHEFANVCKHDVDAGECNGVFQRFAFDTESGECRPFTYGGCGGNGNNFATLAECRIKCQKVALSPGNLCEHDIEVGECSGVFVRFGYDRFSNDCRQFTYGGCGGNGNNFATIQECRNVCVKKVCNPNPQCDLARCQIVNDHDGCPFCSCPPTNQPAPPGSDVSHCPEVDVDSCKDPCIVINNRKGCKDCICPTLPISGRAQPPAPEDEPTAAPPGTRSTFRPVTQTPRPVSGSARPPASPTSVGPPGGLTGVRIAPPGTNDNRVPIRQEAVLTAPSTQTKQLEIDSKQLLPPPLSAQLQEKCMQPVEPGPCKHFVDRWFFNAEDGTCHPFKYGGCAGNRNHFFTQNECEIHCARFLRVVSGDDEEDEEDDDVEEVPRRAAGVTQMRTQEPIGVENYRSPTPFLRGVSTHPHAAHEDLSQPAPESSWEAPTSEEMPGYPMGREPVPLAPTGIGRNMAKLDLDGLEEPTTIIPLATRSQTTASTTQSTTTASTTTTAATTTASTTTEATTEPTTEQTTQGTTTQAPTTTRAATSRPTPQTSAPLVITPPVPKTTAGSPAPSAAVLSARVVCTLPPDAGSCFEYVPRWFFNAQSGQCEQFSYGSCGGNENNFEDRSLCELKCIQTQNSILSHVPERCTYEKSAGFGKGYNVKWYFNMRNLRCEQFVYEGQGGNENQFETLSDCERACSPQPASFAPPVQTTTAATRPPAPATAPPQTLRPISETDESQNPSQEISEDIDQEYDELFSSLPPSAPITAAPTVSPSVSNSVDSRIGVIPRTAPLPPVPEDIRPPGSEPRPPAVQAAKTVIQKEQPAEIPTINVISTEKKKEVYKAEPLPSKPVTSDNEGLPIVGASPPMSVNYQTGEIKNRASGIRTFQESTGRLAVEDSDLTEDEAAKRRSSLSCPNGLQEIRYADGRPVMCLPGKNQCPEKSVCFFNGMDFFCCPNEEDPYDKHVFGGYDGEETKHGYKVFGPLNIRRLMDEVPLRVRRHSVLSRQKRQTSMDSAFNTAPASFNIDSVTAPLRFDDEKPRQVSRAQRMRSKPVPPNHGNPICIEPLVPGDCGAAHLRYYYDRDSDSCRLFYYTGCKGNNNNFGSLIDCQRLCVLEGQRPQPEGRSSTPPPAALRPGQCPDGKAPLGGSAPVLCGNSTDSIGCPVGFFCLAGPPDVCCPRAETEKKEEKSPVRFAPELPGVPRAHSRKAHLSTPKFMCPDASDPLMGQNGNPTPCGAGFDGVKMCPKGFYCAIDVEKQSRMCCPLYGAAERIPSEQVLAPYFGRRPSNPGEVVERGSLPSDQVEFASRSLNSKSLERIPDEESNEDAHPRAPVVEATTTSTFGEDSGEFDEMDEEEEEDGMAHLMLKPAEPSGSSPATSAQPNDSVSEAATEHAIDLPTEPPVVEETTSVKEVVDASVCQIKPSEGRTCREDEQPPRTNLHYFYSPKDRRCKLYFYRGCGGNANRFEKKADCERLCLQ